MTFEHIVQINDVTKPEIPMLTRFQVWEGLVLRARRPDKFLVGVDDYEILEQEPAYMKRCLQLPGLQVIDEVTFWHEARIENRGDSMPYDQYLHEAYVATDVETIQIIRQLAETGVF